MITTEVIHPGGAETFVLRLASALQHSGHNVQLFIFYKKDFNHKLYQNFAGSVPMTLASIPVPAVLSKIDSLLFRCNIDVSLQNLFIVRSLRRLIRAQRIEVIHSHLLKADRLCLHAAADDNIPVVTTIHGDYLQFYQKAASSIKIPLLNYRKKAEYNLQRLKRIVCISDRQISFFKKHFADLTAGKLTKIYNGYSAELSERADIKRQQLGIKPGDFVFGMVSRGIPEKGWRVAIDAFLGLNIPSTHLVLVGESDYLAGLQKEFGNYSNIHFIGHSDAPLEWIQIMSVGLLPTTYMSESLPTVIIEYLCCSIPCIASDAGEIVNMIQYEGNEAGIITPIRGGVVSVDEVKSAMSVYLNDKAVYARHSVNAGLCYQQFDMSKCVNAYCRVYKEAINTKLN